MKRRIEYEMTLDTKIEGNRSLRDWAQAMGIPEARAVDIADTFLSQGIWKAVPRIEIEFVKEQAEKRPIVHRRRRQRVPATTMATSTSESMKPVGGAQDGSASRKEPAAKSATADIDEITWDTRLRSFAVMSRPWSEDWGPEPRKPGCKCPPEILERYGV